MSLAHLISTFARPISLGTESLQQFAGVSNCFPSTKVWRLYLQWITSYLVTKIALYSRFHEGTREINSPHFVCVAVLLVSHLFVGVSRLDVPFIPFLVQLTDFLFSICFSLLSGYCIRSHLDVISWVSWIILDFQS